MQDFEKAWEKMSVQFHPVEKIGTPVIDRRFNVIKGASRKLAVMLNDIHFPYEDKKALRKVMKMVKDLQPDHVILNGDIVDFYTISSFSKDPSRTLSLQDELNSTKDFLGELRDACPDARISYTIGNHEDRLTRYLRSNAKALESLDALKLESLLGLDDYGIRMYGAEGFKLNRESIVLHGGRVSKHAGGTARMEFERHLISGFSGHCHRAGRHDVVGHSKSFFWIEGGCLCELNPEYIEGRPNWQHAVTLIEYTNDRTFPELITLHEGRLVVRGVEY
jgi:predicted phosphodiesterase